MSVKEIFESVNGKKKLHPSYKCVDVWIRVHKVHLEQVCSSEN